MREDVMKNIRENEVLYNKLAKKVIKLGITSGILLSSTVGVAVYEDYNQAYEVKINDEVVAVAKDQSDVEKAIEKLQIEKKDKYNKEVKLENEIAVEKVNLRKTETNREDVIGKEQINEVKTKIDEKVEVLTTGISLKIEGEEVLLADNEEEVQGIIEKIKEEKIQEVTTENTKEIYLVQNIEFTEIEANPEALSDIVTVEDRLRNGKLEAIDYEIQQGETIADIVESSGNSIEEILELNPWLIPEKTDEAKELNSETDTAVSQENVQEEIALEETDMADLEEDKEISEENINEEETEADLTNPEESENRLLEASDGEKFKQETEQAQELDLNSIELRAGDILKINKIKPYISIETIDEVQSEEEILFEEETIWDENLYENETKVEQEGVNGLLNKTTKVVKIDGEETSSEVIAENVAAEKTNKITRVGTKEIPKEPENPIKTNLPNGVGNSMFLRPSEAPLSSVFGPRWGRTHKGLDFAASMGTPIVAADNGVVEIAEFNNGGYGNMVKINHINGYETLYAHASTLNVKPGDIVEKGQLIATVGNTGRSTGPHLHFEIILNGVHLDPSKYI